MERTKRSASAFPFGARNGVWTTCTPASLQVRPHRQAPFRIAVADQDAVVGQRPVVREDQRAGHLLHEHGIRVRRGPENPHASAGEIDYKERVIGDQARGRPHLGREEVRARNGAPAEDESSLLAPETRQKQAARRGREESPTTAWLE